MVSLMGFVVTCCLVPVPAGDVEDGVYAYSSDGKGHRVTRNDGGPAVLGQRVGREFGRAVLRSVANDNSRFTLDLKGAGPLAEGADKMQLALVVGGVCLPVWGHSDPHSDGTIDLSCSVHGEEAARRVAAALKVKPRLRQHPGHRFTVRWSPEQETYQVGEPVTLTMEIRNIGPGPFTFFVGGKQRGPRDNQFRFLAYRCSGHGRAVPDTGDPTNFGGLGSYHTLKPGETFRKSVPLDKWFTFADPDVYRVTGLFELDLSGGDERLGDGTLWNDLAVGDCTVHIEAKKE